MWKYIKCQEKYVNDVLNTKNQNFNWKKLKEEHERKIRYMQHERQVHLIVTMSVCLFLALSLGLTMFFPGPYTYGADLTLMSLTLPYMLHYYRLENGVQRLYYLADKIEENCEKYCN